MNKTKRFIASQGSATTVKVFLADTGQLYRTINTGPITASPICTESELTVQTKGSDGKLATKIYGVPSFNLKQTINL